MGSYISAFIVPIDTKKVLTNMGWVFDSKNRLSVNITNFLTSHLHLHFKEKYLNIETYSNDRFQASVIMDDSGDVENVHIKIYNGHINLLRSEFIKYNDSQVELFIPSETDLKPN